MFLSAGPWSLPCTPTGSACTCQQGAAPLCGIPSGLCCSGHPPSSDNFPLTGITRSGGHCFQAPALKLWRCVYPQKGHGQTSRLDCLRTGNVLRLSVLFTTKAARLETNCSSSSAFAGHFSLLKDTFLPLPALGAVGNLCVCRSDAGPQPGCPPLRRGIPWIRVHSPLFFPCARIGTNSRS